MANSNIKAYYRQEERYIGLSLEFSSNIDSSRELVLKHIEDLKKELQMKPDILGNNNKTSIYLEFGDDYDKDAGNFFEFLLKRLNIEKCENCDI